MWLPVSWQQANGLAGTVVKSAGGQYKQRGQGEVDTACAAMGWDSSRLPGGSEPYLTQVLP